MALADDFAHWSSKNRGVSEPSPQAASSLQTATTPAQAPIRPSTAKVGNKRAGTRVSTGAGLIDLDLPMTGDEIIMRHLYYKDADSM